jgi:hypothetical protein
MRCTDRECDLLHGKLDRSRSLAACVRTYVRACVCVCATQWIGMPDLSTDVEEDGRSACMRTVQVDIYICTGWYGPGGRCGRACTCTHVVGAAFMMGGARTKLTAPHKKVERTPFDRSGASCFLRPRCRRPGLSAVRNVT